MSYSYLQGRRFCTPLLRPTIECMRINSTFISILNFRECVVVANIYGIKLSWTTCCKMASRNDHLCPTCTISWTVTERSLVTFFEFGRPTIFLGWYFSFSPDFWALPYCCGMSVNDSMLNVFLAFVWGCSATMCLHLC